VKPALRFLGTRGEIPIRTRRHRRHTSLLLKSGGLCVMIDRGADWLRLPPGLRPDAIVLTHAHPDHAFGLAGGAECPVFATEATLGNLAAFPLADRRVVQPGKPFRLGGFRFEAFPLEHSLRAPAVGYRISAGRRRVFYCPDVAWIPDRRRAIGGIDLYIGDGATVSRPMVRKAGPRLYGHASIHAQIGWCAKAGVTRAIFTHCGRGIVGGDGRRLAVLVRRMGKERGVDARIAHDGWEIPFP
jgi:phosphoribosyl 1,2-cyclic phosphodiesterase